ncbi:MAG: response regulator transcription factor [Betaproteobacteria bacterium]
MRLLLVEDDIMIGESLAEALRSDRFVVDWFRDGTSAEGALVGMHYDIVLLDLGLPGKDGIAVLRSMRSRRDRTPVVIVTARDDLEDRVAGLNAGADDYVSKPFEMDELLARLHAILRRSGGRPETLFEHGTVCIDRVTREVRVDGQVISLTGREWSVLEALIARPGQVQMRARLEEKVFGHPEEIAASALDVLVHRLRRKLGNELIVNVRGVGYLVPK